VGVKERTYLGGEKNLEGDSNPKRWRIHTKVEKKKTHGGLKKNGKREGRGILKNCKKQVL